MSSGRADRGAALQLRGISRNFGRVVAVRDVDLDIASGEFVTLLGPSGSGKTTTLNVIAGFIAPTAGDVLVDGKSIRRLPAHKRDMGMVFQNYALFPHLNAAENVAFPLRERHQREDEIRRRVEQAFELVRLRGFEARLPDQLSGGQQQRVALARAIVFSPRVLLMDEPLGALDRKLRERLQTEIRRLHRELGVTVIFVTHDQEEALALSDRIAVFNNGSIEQIGTPQELWARPVTPFVAAFLGESNLIRGVVGEGSELRTDSGVYRTAANGMAVGAPATLLIRPEQVRVGATAGSDGNSVPGTVVDSMFRGGSRRLTIACGAAGTFLATEAAGSFSAASEGDAVTIGWRSQDSVLLDGVDPSVRHVGMSE